MTPDLAVGAALAVIAFAASVVLVVRDLRSQPAALAAPVSLPAPPVEREHDDAIERVELLVDELEAQLVALGAELARLDGAA